MALVKFPDPIGFEKAFREHYVHPNRTHKLGGYRMLISLGIIQSASVLRLGAGECGLMRLCAGAGNGEFIGWESVKACLDEWFMFTFGNKRCDPPFPGDGWYRHRDYEYNGCSYQPMGWEKPCRFVVMRVRKDQMGDRQLKRPDSENYVHRIFVTNKTGRPHCVIADYDQRADAKNLIGEAHRQGAPAIPSMRFQAHHAYFQIVMPAYNLWHRMKMLTGHTKRQKHQGAEAPEARRITMPDHTLRIARLKMFFCGGEDLVSWQSDEAGGLDYAAVSVAIRRLEQRLREDRALQKA